jgi:hypothetical protein
MTRLALNDDTCVNDTRNEEQHRQKNADEQITTSQHQQMSKTDEW